MASSNYRRAGQQSENYIARGERPDYYNARGGPGSIDAHIYNPKLMGGGIDALKLVNSPYGRQNGIGYRQAEEGIAGMRRDLSDPNRPLFDLNQGGVNPYGNGTVMANQSGNQAPQQAPQGPNEDQQRWAQANVKPQIGAGQTVQEMGQFAQKLPFMGGFGRGMEGYGKQLSSVEPQASSGGGNFSRASLIEGARKTGELADIIKDYNAKGAASGHVMDDKGNITYKPEVFRKNTLQPQADDIRARRNFATGNQPATFINPMKNPNADEMNPQPMMGSKFGRYGGGSSLIGSANTPQVTSGGVMPNPITGQAMKMNPYLKDQDAVTKTKSGPDKDKAGEKLFNAKSMASAMKSAKPLDAAKGKYFRDKVRGIA